MIYLQLFLTFLKIGITSFGGGLSMIAIIQQEVMSHGWLTQEELLNFIGIAESTPGPIAVNMATFIGSNQGGILGALCATVGVVLPSFIIILLIASVMKSFIKNKYVQAALDGIKPVMIGMIFATGILFLIGCLFFNWNFQEAYKGFDYKALIIALLILVFGIVVKLAFKKRLSPIMIILISAGLGMGIYAIPF